MLFLPLYEINLAILLDRVSNVLDYLEARHMLLILTKALEYTVKLALNL